MLENSLRLAVQTGKVVYGHDKTVKMAKEKKAKLIVVASNYRKDRELVEKNSYNGIPVLRFNGTNVELGRICGKKFAVSVLGIIDPGNSNILNEKA
ncbi:MAG: 50S ribosomal protein L30e [Thermoplasmata archaeon]|nr:50S ribosomal protein L30e [Thermoplasmata archaeon]